jgi:hypothetical protein
MFKQTSIAFIALLGLSSAATAQTAQADSCARPDLISSVKLESIPGSDLLTVATTVDGSPEKLLLGIGDLSTQLWNAQAAKLDLTVLPRSRFMDAGGRFSEGSARVGKFALGNMETGGFDIAVRPDPDFAQAGFDGLLGTNMMQRYDIDLDFARGRLNYFSPEQCEDAGVYWAPAAVSSVPFEANSGIVYVPVTLDGHRIVALLDTSADRTILNPQLASRLFGLEAGSLQPANVTNGGALIKTGMHTFSSLTLGGLIFNNPQIAIPFDILSQNTHEFHASKILRDRYNLSEFLPPMIIGMDVLKQSHLYISFRNQRIYVSAAGDGRTLDRPAPTEAHWFNVWRYGHDYYLPYIHKLFAL